MHKKKKKHKKGKKKKKGNLKKIKGYVPSLTKNIDCTDMFKQPKKAMLSVTYCYNRETLGDMFFDIRMTNSTKGIKPKKFGTVSITVNGGKIGLTRMMKFLTNNKEKFLTIRKRTAEMEKKRRKK